MAITIVGQPDQIMPAYNPVVYYLNSNNKAFTGFRYIIQIYDAGTATLLAEFKVAPRPTDGYGYVDISKIVQSKLSSYLNINAASFSSADTGTVYNYDLKFGEEYVATKAWQSYQSSGTTPAFVRINSTAHGYVAGDQIKLTTSVTYTDARQALNGYFTVQSVVNANAYVINLSYVPGMVGLPASGTSQYADNRILRYTNLTSLLNRRVFNRAYEFQDWPSYTQSQIILGSSTKEILTNAPNTGFYIRPDQRAFWNFWDNKQNLCKYVLFQNDAGETFYMNTSSTASFVKQVNVAYGISPIGLGGAVLPLVKSTTLYYDVWSTSSNQLNVQTSEKQRLYIDRICPINETQILFLDRAGSWSSFSFPLRQIETGQVTRDAYRKELGGLKAGAYTYATTDTGTTNWYISNTKNYTLNTSWITDEMSVYFEELITSPQTFVLFDGSVSWLACQIVNSNYTIERSKNKKLIRKTIEIRLANNDNINI